MGDGRYGQTSPGRGERTEGECLSPLPGLPYRGYLLFTTVNPGLTPGATLYRPYGAVNLSTATLKMVLRAFQRSKFVGPSGN